MREVPEVTGRAGALLGVAAATLAAAGLPAAVTAQDDNPALRSAWFLEQRAYPGIGGLAARLQAARARAEAMPVAARPPGPAGAVGAGPWEPLGPHRIPQGIAATGRVSAIALHPEDPGTLYIGAAQGGVWKTTDGGGSWTPLTENECSLAMGGLALDPADPEIVYAGTGEQHFSGDSYYGCGVLRSTDGGESWVRLGAGEMGSRGGGGARISRVVVDPSTAGTADATTVLVASTFGLFRSEDSGLSWRETLGGIVTDLVMHPGDPRILWAGVYGDGIHRSDDGGRSWSRQGIPLPGGRTGRINLAVAPSDGQVLYASVHDVENGRLLGMLGTTSGGSAWVELSATDAGCRSQCWYDMALAVDPLDPTLVYFGGVFLFRSDDGGNRFRNITGSGPIIHVDQHLIAPDPSDPATIYVANDGGVYRSRNRGDSWESLNTDLSLTQFYPGVSIHPRDPAVVLGGTQDNGTVLSSGSVEWELVLGGDGGYTAIHPMRPDRRWAETQWGGSFSGPRRSDGGGGWVQKFQGIDFDDDGAFIPPLVMDPYEPGTLYFGTSRVYRTRDEGESWSALSPRLDDGVVTSIGPSRSDGEVVWATTSRGGAFVTRNGGATWDDVSAGLPDRFLTEVAVHPRDPATAWITASGFGAGHVFVTRDGGATWADASGTLPDVPVNAILLDPGDPEQVFIGTDLGIFVSMGGGSWERFDEGLPNVAVFDLSAEPGAGLLVAATHGRGAWTVPLQAPRELEVRTGERTASHLSNASPDPDSLRVGLYGSGWPDAEWSADEPGASWIVLERSSGVGRSHLRWRLDPSGLPGGDQVDTVSLRTAGVADPVRLVLRMRVRGADTLVVEAAGRSGVSLEGDGEPLPDSVGVEVAGPTEGELAWTATHGGSSWLTLVDSTGTGAGTIRWERDPAGLDVGIRVDTIFVTGVGLEPAMVVDTLRIEEPLAVALEPGTPRDGPSPITVEGLERVFPDSVSVLLTGFGADTARWTARTAGTGDSGGSDASDWLRIVDDEGTGGERLRWERRTQGLPVGVHVDSIVVQAGEGPHRVTATVVDSVTVAPPVSPDRAVGGVLEGGGAGLTALQRAALDALGNGNGGFDLGDALAWLARCEAEGDAAAGAAACGGGP